MIESISIRNYKVLREIDLDLKPLTVIVGPNASGKSSVLQAIALLSGWFGGGGDRPAQFFEQSLSRRSSTGPAVISCKAKIGETRAFFSLDLIERNVSQQGPWLKWRYSFLNFDTKKLAAPSYPQNTSLVLPSDGEGLSSILAGLQLEQPVRFSRIVEQLKSVITPLVDIRVRRTQLELGKIGYELLFDLQGAEAIPAHAVSEGTLLTLGVLTALSTCDSPQITLIDDIERGLHPKAIEAFIGQLRLLQKQDPELQIVAASHSPYLLDYLQADEVLLTSLDEDGYTAVRPLTEHPEYERWKGLMAPGEFWSSVGEGWVAKNNKATAG